MREYAKNYRAKNREKVRTTSRQSLMRKRIKDTGMTKCYICEKPVEDRGFHTHHVNYEKNKLVLLCYICHGWLHGYRRTYKHPFKEKYGGDYAPFMFASKIVEMYMEHDPKMQEKITINAITLEEV